MLNLHPIPTFTDNYVWLLSLRGCAWVVDPGDASPVLEHLSRHHLQLKGVLLTHHHRDHTGGVEALREATGATVWGPAHEVLPGHVHRLQGGDTVPVLGMDFQVLDVPGHTAGHIALYTEDTPLGPLLFCGDTLFSGGCGRLFEGTPEQMLASLDTLARLPGNTLVCCAHEYTLSNLRFAQAVEPDNADLAAYTAHCQHLRDTQRPTLPSTLAQELRINPFLRSRQPSITAMLRQIAPDAQNDAERFAALREWKNRFQ